MGKLTTQKLSRMSRRRFIESLASLGVTGSALTLMSKDTLAETTENPEKEVPRLFGWRHTNHDDVVNKGARPEREPIYYKIPRHKWARVEAAHDAKERVSTILEEEFEKSVPVGVTTHGSGSNRRKVVEVEYQILESPKGDEIKSPSVEFSEFKQTIEEKVGTTITGIAGKGTKKETRQAGIPVTVDRTRRVQTYSYDYEYRESGVPAGCLIRRPGGGVCTSGTPVWDNEIGDHVMVTAGHCLENINDIYQNDVDDSDHFGNVNQDKLKATGDFDAGIIDDLEFGITSGFAGNASVFS